MAQIRLFKALGLRVKAESELKRWEEEIEKDLIKKFKLKKCIVSLRRIDETKIKPVEATRARRIRVKKHTHCIMCNVK